MERQKALVVDHVTKRFAGNAVLQDVSFELEPREFLAILGPSGAGKSTLLAIIGGHLAPDAGDVQIFGRSTAGLAPERIPTATVFQSHALFPHLSVGENVAFGLRVRGTAREKILERVSEVLELVGLGGFAGRRIAGLSGGESQRVATARALAIRPDILLMDEPLAALDKNTKERLELDLKELLHRLGLTTVYVTHDQAEALLMADRIAVLDRGRLEQIGEPQEVYLTPASAFVARFVGGANLVSGVVEREVEDGRVVVRCGTLATTARGSVRTGASVVIAIRPESVWLQTKQEGQGGVEAIVSGVHYLGATTRYTVDGVPINSPSGGLSSVRPGPPRFEVGAQVRVHVDEGAAMVVEKRAEGPVG
jgi:spermidine/putrescine transport system ATP-binding protein